MNEFCFKIDLSQSIWTSLSRREAIHLPASLHTEENTEQGKRMELVFNDLLRSKNFNEEFFASNPALLVYYIEDNNEFLIMNL